MRKIECLRFSWKIIRQKSAVPIMIMFVVAFFCVFKSLQNFSELYKDMSQPVDIRCSVSGNIDETTDQTIDETIEEINKSNSVAYISEYYESEQVMSYNGYTTDIVLIGMDAQYMASAFADELVVPLAETMPYILLDKSALQSMKDNKKNKMPIESEEDFLLKPFAVGDGNTNKARVCGITQQNQSRKKQPQYVYTTIKGYELLTDVSAERQIKPTEQNQEEKQQENQQEPAQMDTPSVAEEHAEGTMDYLIKLESGFSLGEITRVLEEQGVTLKEDSPTEQMSAWKSKQSEGIWTMLLSLLSFACAGTLLYSQGKSWQHQHEAFLMYVQQCDRTGTAFRNMYRYRLVWYLLTGFIGGLIVQLGA